MRKLLVLGIGLLAGVLLVGLAIASRMGAFRSPELSREDRGPYTIACLPHRGAYNAIGEKILKVRELLGLPAEQLGSACAIYHDLFRESENKGQPYIQGGYVLKSPRAVAAPVEVVSIPRREVLLARFRGHPVLTAQKVYPAMFDWMRENGFEQCGPVLEFYGKGVVETEVPIRPAGR